MFFAAISNQETAINTFISFWVSNPFLGHKGFYNLMIGDLSSILCESIL